MSKYPFDKAAWRWVKDVVLEKAPSLNYSCYMVNEGRVTTSNGRFTCSHPIADENTYMVVGKELERVFPVMDDGGEGLQASLTERLLVITRKGFRANLPRLKYEEWTQQKPKGNWTPLPKGFMEAIKTLRPFVSDNANQSWATGICFYKDAMFATDNVTVIRYSMDFPTEKALIIPLWVIDFILAREGVQDIEVDAQHIAFRWENGAWMTSVLIEGEYPENIRNLVEGAPEEEAEEQVSEEWRSGINAIAHLATGALRVRADVIKIGYGNSEVEVEVPTQLAEGVEETLWPPKGLLNAINVASFWNPKSWPKPAVFVGGKNDKGKHSIKGLIAGRSS